MGSTYWHRQSQAKPLFPELFWSRPENRTHAGKLLIIGGNVHGFAAPGEAYQRANEAGIGTTRVLLPVAVKKVAGKLLPEIEYAPSTPSGSFSRAALADWLEQAVWADGVLLAGDIGRNSETAIVMENFLQKFNGRLVITKDAADYLLGMPLAALQRSNTLLVLTMAQLQKLAQAVKYPAAFTLGMDLMRLVDNLHDFTSKFAAYIIVKHLDMILVAINGQISTTPISDAQAWRLKTATTASVWWLQNRDKPFEAITTAVCDDPDSTGSRVQP